MENDSTQICREEKVISASPSKTAGTRESHHVNAPASRQDDHSISNGSLHDSKRALSKIDRCGDLRSSRSAASTSWTYRLVSAGLAFSVWGGWGYFVNSQEAAAAASPIVSGLLHGLFSSMVTIVMLTSVTWLYRRFAQPGPGMLIPAVTTSIATGSCITTAHVIIGTANVPATVIPGLVVAFCFNLITTKKLSQADQASSTCKTSLV